MAGVGTNGDLVNLTQAAEILGGMRRPNVDEFLKRRGVEPVDKTPFQRRWRRADIEHARDEYQASERYAADQRRREAAQR